MPLRNYCITTVFLQIFSLLTFFSFYGNDKGSFKFIQKDGVIKSDADKIEERRFETYPLAQLCLRDEMRNRICPLLFMGKEFSPSLIEFKHDTTPFQCRLSELMQDCSKLIEAHEYNVKHPSESEKNFPLAFAIKMHRDPEQAEQLLRTIYRPHNVYCIYVDAKSSVIIQKIMAKIAGCFDNVFVVEERLNVVYASFAHMHSDFQCMNVLMRTKITWRYYINLTGQEFPLKTNLEIVEILRSLNGANDIETYDIPVFLKWRHEKHYYVSAMNIVETSQKKKPFAYDLQISKGSAYGAFSRRFVDFILTDGVANNFIHWLNDTYSPEESVWATLNTLPWAPGGYEYEIRHRYGNFLSRSTIWENDKVKCHGKFVRGICILTVKNLPWLLSQPTLFANKFNIHSDRLVLNCLEDLNRNRTHNPDVYSLDWFYYKHLPHVKLYASRDSSYFSEKNVTKMKLNWLKNKSNKLKRRTEKKDTEHLPGSSINIYTVPA